MNIDSFFYLGMYLLTFTAFPYGNYGLGSTKSLAIFPLIIYIVLKACIFGKLKFSKRLIIESMFIIPILLVSCFDGLFKYGNVKGFSQAVNMFAVYYITLCSLHLYLYNGNKEKLFRMVKCIFDSFTFSLIFGVLQFLYFYLARIESLRNLMLLFLRDNNYLGVGKIQFNFDEPGIAGIGIILLFVPCIIMLRKMGYKFSLFDKLKIVFIFMLGFFTISPMYYTIMLVTLGSYILAKRYKNSKIKVVVTIVLIIALVMTLVILENPLFLYNLNPDNRFLALLIDTSRFIQEDNSAATRVAFWGVSIVAFISKPLFGYGWGYFQYAFTDNFYRIDSVFRTSEFMGYYDMNGLQSMSFFSTILSEAGLLGLFWMLYIFNSRRKTLIHDMIPFVLPLFVALLQHDFLYNVMTIVIIELYTNKDINQIYKECSCT